MSFNSIAEIIEDYRQGKMVLLVDDEESQPASVWPARVSTPPSLARNGKICL